MPAQIAFGGIRCIARSSRWILPEAVQHAMQGLELIDRWVFGISWVDSAGPVFACRGCSTSEAGWVGFPLIEFCLQGLLKIKNRLGCVPSINLSHRGDLDGKTMGPVHGSWFRGDLCPSEKWGSS